jgi:hypothetical protein
LDERKGWKRLSDGKRRDSRGRERKALASTQDLGVNLVVYCFLDCKSIELRAETTSPVLVLGTIC